MNTWALIIFFHVGFAGDQQQQLGGEVLTGFTSQYLCEQAARELPKLVHGTKKEVRSVCVQVTDR